ncbi:MAG: hypothetical protein A2904_00090 [Candidatus Staskawiczbacteria bacterium RIFCSPLOWO2_01_FULL_33_9]|uniref:Uncharacterized protein n=1 Tax=Candidatus Staskawiczbacteria bacterium RIFCSPLOWO2_01_FULL_33_9 TaxID=1802211 RepID=A0A1G2I696_9BACT|nr:MAG: hypothetical protein A2904_00090 [Candidatus Staskawiczbacteria bacterium RIFCSPLOWO2_01_FULL_33_9]
MILKIFLISFLINIIWEFCHCGLYSTCVNWQSKKRILLLTFASFKDALFIVIFYLISIFSSENKNILEVPLSLFYFIALSLLFSFIDEKLSIKYKRWEYSLKMPKVFGVGITPLLELAITGTITFIIVWAK